MKINIFGDTPMKKKFFEAEIGFNKNFPPSGFQNSKLGSIRKLGKFYNL